MKNIYLIQAQELYALSKKELNNSKLTSSDELARDASGKAWLATTDALRGFLLSQGLKEKELPKSDHDRQTKLAQYGNETMRKLFGRIKGDIHQDAYYEGMVNYIFLYEAFKDVKKFIYRCENGG